jgi:CCGSCS motif protein
MKQLFKEVTSPKNTDKAEAEKLNAGAAQESPEDSVVASEDSSKKGKHGDSGVCCGGCS